MQIAILGGGIAGLATGWYLRKYHGESLSIIILEKEKQPGGWVRTIRHGDFLFEQGPRSLRTAGNGRITLELIEELGLQQSVAFPASQALSRFIYDGKQLQKLPQSLLQIPFNPLMKGWFCSLIRELWTKKGAQEDESVYDFFCRRIGRSWTEKMIDPFVLGIYAGDIRRLSIRSAFPVFYEREQQFGSLLKGAFRLAGLKPKAPTPLIQKASGYPMISFREGMETLPKALAQSLKDEIRTANQVTALKTKGTRVAIELFNGAGFEVDCVISTLPTHHLAPLLPDAPLLAEKLQQLRYASVATVNFGFEQTQLPFNGFGYLVPSSLNESTLGTIFDSSLFLTKEMALQTRLSVMMGGVHHPEVVHLPKSTLIHRAQAALARHLGITTSPCAIHLSLAKKAIPQYEIGYALWKKEIEALLQKEYPRVLLGGSGFAGVALNDAIAFAKNLSLNLAVKQ